MMQLAARRSLSSAVHSVASCRIVRAMDERFDALETKVAYHDKELAELHAVVYQQQLVIERLQAQLSRATEQLKWLGVEGDTEKHQKPPHY